MSKANIKMQLPSIIFIILLLIGWIIIEYRFNPEPDPEIALTSLDELQEKSIEIIIEMNKQMISLALLIIGGLGAFLLQKYQHIKIESFTARIILVCCGLFSVFSILFGYILYDKLVEMLSNRMFNPTNPLIEKPRDFQYYCLWLGVIAFIVFVLIEITPRAEHQQKKDINKEISRNERKT